MSFDKQITLAFTGASGAPYGLRLLETLISTNHQVFLLISSAARVVLATEEDLKVPASPDAATALFSERFAAK
jgi:4-hydroxy-3-polyprenylbenzoate decarboxylase